MQLGELAADRGFALAEAGGEIGQRFSKARPGFEHDQRCGHTRQFGNAGAACTLFGRQESNEEELVRGQAGDRQRRQNGRSTGDRRDGVAGLLHGADELVARVGNERRAGIRYQRDRRPFRKPLQKLRPCCRGVVVVVGCQRGSDGISVEQLARHPRIFAGDEVGGRER